MYVACLGARVWCVLMVMRAMGINAQCHSVVLNNRVSLVVLQLYYITK